MSPLHVADLRIAGVPGPEVDPIDLITALMSVDVAADRSDDEALEVVAAWELVRTWVDAQAARALADFARRPETFGATSGESQAPLGECLRSHPGEELAVRCGISISIAGHRVGTALALADRHLATWQAMSQARIDTSRAQFLIEACLELDDDQARAVERELLPRSADLDAPRWRRTVRHHVIAVDPRSARERRERATADRRVSVRAVENGMAELWALLPAEAALAIATALDARARSIRSERDGRTLKQLRADVLVEVFEHSLRTGELVGSGPLGEHAGHRAHLHVTVPLSVLLGIDDGPAHLDGYGPITAEVAREIASDATWRRVLTDPATVEIVEVGSTAYRPPAALQRHVEARDGTCRFPGCARAAERCDLDHTVPFPHGSTQSSNLGALCRRHHLYKHGASRTQAADGRTRVRQIQPGVFAWRLPTGAEAIVRPNASEESSTTSHGDALIKRLREQARRGSHAA